jgi:hypothetical protein
MEVCTKFVGGRKGRQKTKRIHGSYDLARKVLWKKLSTRDETRHLDVKKEINYRMTELIDRYWTHYGSKKASVDREKSIVEGIRSELGRRFVREVDGIAVQRWYERLTGVRGLADNTVVRHFNVMHHMMEKASTIWSKETGIDRNPADLVEVNRPDESRERYLSEDGLHRLKVALDEKMGINILDAPRPNPELQTRGLIFRMSVHRVHQCLGSIPSGPL